MENQQNFSNLNANELRKKMRTKKIKSVIILAGIIITAPITIPLIIIGKIGTKVKEHIKF